MITKEMKEELVAKYGLKEGDTVEVVRFVGGG